MLSFCFLLKSLLSLYVPIEIFTFSSLVYWNPYFPSTFLVKSLPSLHFSIEILTLSVLFCWNLSFPSTFLVKSLLSLHFSAEISRKHVGYQIQKKIPKLKKIFPQKVLNPFRVLRHFRAKVGSQCFIFWAKAMRITRVPKLHTSSYIILWWRLEHF